MNCEQQPAMMPISPALEESKMEGSIPKDVEDGEGLSQDGDAEVDEEEEGRKSVGRKGPKAYKSCARRTRENAMPVLQLVPTLREVESKELGPRGRGPSEGG